MQASRDRRTQAMIKDYGLIAANSKRKAPFFEDRDDHRLRLKRAPIQQARAFDYNIVLGDIASPGESKHAARMLRQREKRKLALETQHRKGEQRLEAHFKLSSPATQLSRAIKIDERKHNAIAKPLMKQNPVLYQEFRVIKTWNTT